MRSPPSAATKSLSTASARHSFFPTKSTTGPARFASQLPDLHGLTRETSLFELARFTGRHPRDADARGRREPGLLFVHPPTAERSNPPHVGARPENAVDGEDQDAGPPRPFSSLIDRSSRRRRTGIAIRRFA